MRIGEVPMKCKRCGYICPLEECNADDLTEDGDGHFGCPQPDCGGTALELNPKVTTYSTE